MPSLLDGVVQIVCEGRNQNGFLIHCILGGGQKRITCT